MSKFNHDGCSNEEGRGQNEDDPDWVHRPLYAPTSAYSDSDFADSDLESLSSYYQELAELDGENYEGGSPYNEFAHGKFSRSMWRFAREEKSRPKNETDHRGYLIGFGSFYSRAPYKYSKDEFMANQGHPDRIRTVDCVPSDRKYRQDNDDDSKEPSDWEDRTGIEPKYYMSWRNYNIAQVEKAIARVEEINRKKMYRKKRYGTSKYDFWNDPNVSDIHKQEHARALKEDEADSFNRKITLARDEADSFKRSDN